MSIDAPIIFHPWPIDAPILFYPRSIDAPILIDSIRAALPTGVQLSLHPHRQVEIETKYSENQKIVHILSSSFFIWCRLGFFFASEKFFTQAPCLRDIFLATIAYF